MSAINTTGSTLNVVNTGTPVPLPNSQILNNFTANADNTNFTAQEAGTYMITYSVNTADNVQMTSSVEANGAGIPGSVLSPPTATNNYTQTFMTRLNAGDTLALQLANHDGPVTLTTNTGATMTAVRIA